MWILTDTKFYRSVPRNYSKKINNLVEKLNFDSKNLFTHGKYCRKIKGTENKYKFRINNGDRIVFQYEKDAVRLLRFCHHDEQIRIAERINSEFIEEETQLNVVYSDYVEDNFDYQIDKDIIDSIKNHLLDDNLDNALEQLKVVGAEHSNKAKHIRKVQNIEEHRNFFLQNKKLISKISIQNTLIKNRNGELTFTFLRKKDIQYAINRLVTETGFLIFPFFYYRVSDTGYNRDAYIDKDLSDKRKIAENMADYCDKEIGDISIFSGLELYVLLQDTDDNIIPLKNINICPYDKSYICRNVDKIDLRINDQINSYVQNTRIIKSKDKIKNINMKFLGI